ncbi:MAG: hypothetical protein RLZ63_1348, partial [Pseudomonadota bacterium]
ALHIAQLFNLGFEFGNGLLEIEKRTFGQVFLLKRVQYATGTGSSERQIYQVATVL